MIPLSLKHLERVRVYIHNPVVADTAARIQVALCNSIVSGRTGRQHFGDHGDPLEAALREIVRRAQSALVQKRVILFGSRARGDARPDSDLNLAFEHASSDAAWADFVNEMHDEAATLLPLDLLDLGRADAALRASIEQHGRLLHG